LRLERGYSQQQFATYINISQRAYSYKEAGKREFSISEVENILKFLNVEPLELLDLE
ncbi:transcriptional regulator, partial [Clostridium sp. HMSC19D07]